MKNQRSGFHLPLLISILFVMTSMLILPLQTHAKLPPRPTPASSVAVSTPVPLSGTLQLKIQPILNSMWSVVQWQDADGNWHDVEGWRGEVNDGQTIWWVKEGDWGKGPFRWVVYQSQGGPLVAISESFSLPGSGETLFVMVNVS